jgi:hypothetical protein
MFSIYAGLSVSEDDLQMIIKYVPKQGRNDIDIEDLREVLRKR